MAREFSNISIADLEAGNKALASCPMHLVSGAEVPASLGSSTGAAVNAWKIEGLLNEAGIEVGVNNYKANDYTAATINSDLPTTSRGK